jgi:DNA (cytosine-5)-methyltransferase 1
MGRIDYESETLIAHALRGEGHDASEDGTGRGIPLVPMAIQEDKQNGVCVRHTVGSLRADAPGSQPCGSLVAQPVAFNWQSGGDFRIQPLEDQANFLQRSQTQAVCFQTHIARNGCGQPSEVVPALTSCEGGTHADSKPHVAEWAGTRWAVRRLTPRECERLQGFPDDFTLVPYRGKLASDSPRYKALGNSMAIPAIRRIGVRIQAVTDLLKAGSA